MEPNKNRLLKISIVLICLLLLVTYTFFASIAIVATVTKAPSLTDTLQRGANYVVTTAGKINIIDPDPIMRALAPRSIIDPMYMLLLFLLVVISIGYFWEFSYTRPFDTKILHGLRICFWLILIFLIANFFRYDWFNQQIKKLTGGQFAIAKPFPLALPEFWVLLILIRLIVVFKKAIFLQNESDLTV